MEKKQENEYQRLGNRLKEVRQKYKLKQEAIAKMLGISKQQYSLYENGKRQMPIKHYIILAHEYQVTMDYLTTASSAYEERHTDTSIDVVFAKEVKKLYEKHYRKKY